MEPCANCGKPFTPRAIDGQDSIICDTCAPPEERNIFGRTHAEIASYTSRKIEDIDLAECSKSGFCPNCGWTPAPPRQ